MGKKSSKNARACLQHLDALPFSQSCLATPKPSFRQQRQSLRHLENPPEQKKTIKKTGQGCADNSKRPETHIALYCAVPCPFRKNKRFSGAFFGVVKASAAASTIYFPNMRGRVCMPNDPQAGTSHRRRRGRLPGQAPLAGACKRDGRSAGKLFYGTRGLGGGRGREKEEKERGTHQQGAAALDRQETQVFLERLNLGFELLTPLHLRQRTCNQRNSKTRNTPDTHSYFLQSYSLSMRMNCALGKRHSKKLISQQASVGRS
jgi:hypothetical protein